MVQLAEPCFDRLLLQRIPCCCSSLVSVCLSCLRILVGVVCPTYYLDLHDCLGDFDGSIPTGRIFGVFSFFFCCEMMFYIFVTLAYKFCS